MNNIIQTIRHAARAATVLLLALCAAQTAWAEEIATYYLDKDGTRYDVNATVLTGNEPVDEFGEITLAAGWYVVNSNIQYTDVTISCYGDVNLILADGTTMTFNNSDGNAIWGAANGSLTIYGQTLGTGTLDATSNTTKAIDHGGDITINGGIVKATGTSNIGIHTNSNLTINGGTVDADGYYYGLIAGNVTINSGNVTATGGDDCSGIEAYAEITINGGIVDAKGGSGLYAHNIAINGGKVSATATGDYDAGIYADDGTITLGWTRASDFIQANSYSGTVSVKGSLAFLTDDATPVTISGNNIAPASINGRKLTPDLSPSLTWDGNAYTITNTKGWGYFCDMQEGGETFSGKTVVLDGDIGTAAEPVTRMGSSTTQFRGTFNGAGHTLTVQYGTPSEPVNQQFVAPFPNVTGGATFRNLTIAGSIYSGYATSGDKGTGGLIGHLFGSVTVEHCVSTVTVNAASDHAGGFVGLCEHAVTFTDCVSSATVTCTGSGSGFVGWSRDSKYTIAFYGCLFSGKVLKQGNVGSGNGSFVGWKGFSKTVTITNCIAAPATDVNMATDNSATFCRYSADTTKDNGETHITNGYYTQTLGNAQGKARHTVTAGTDVTVAHAGVATHYATSGITAYKATGASADSDPFIAGLLYNNNVVDVLYAGIDDVVSLTLSNTAPGDVPDGYQYGYTASAGTLSGTGNPYTLTMPDQDVTVSVNTDDLVAIDWATVSTGADKDNAYMIYNNDQLDLLAHRVNGTHGETAVVDGYSGKYFKLGKDIKYPHKADGEEGADAENNYEAIGGRYDDFRSFLGHFDGNNKTISGIRIYKGGDTFQGIFGLTGSGADIHHLTLADARITGYQFTGGIVGENYNGTVTRCHVAADVAVCAVRSGASYHGGIVGYNSSGTIEQCTSAVTLTTADASNKYYGGIAGYNSYGTLSDNLAIGATVPALSDNSYGAITGYNDGGTLQRNYYTACKVADTENATGVGCNNADVTANNGARAVFALTLADGITTTTAATVTIGTTGYYAQGTAIALSYTGTPGNIPDGYQYEDGDGYTASAGTLSGSTLTMPDQDVTVSPALRSTGKLVPVSYLDADGNTVSGQTAIALDGTESNLTAGWYFVGLPTVAFDHTLNLNGNVHLILADGKTMTLNGNTMGINGGYNLTIYGQSLDAATAGTLRYNGTSVGISAYNYEQHSGNVSITTTDSGVRGINAYVTLRGGTLTISANGDNARAINGIRHSILGGQLTATGATGIFASANDGTAITLGWTRPADRITASSISTRGGTVAVADGKAFTDGSGNIYTGTLSAASLLSGFDAKTTLQPALQLADNADNATQIATLNGIETAAILAGRTLYKDGSWNTLCLPFSVTTASGTLSGDNVQAMTLNTSSSSLADGTLTLNFDDATTIPAGTPFIIKWDNTGVNIENPVFEGVTVSNATNDATVTDVLTFTGTYAPVSIGSDGDNTKLYLGAANTLYYPNAAMTIGTHRAYFQLLGGLTAGDPASGVRAFVLNFGDETTGISDATRLNNKEEIKNNDWYTLDGRKLSGKPTAPGIYVNNGRKVVIK